MKLIKHFTRKEGFGRVELVATVGAVLMLATVSLFGFKKIQNGNNDAVCMSNLKQLGAGIAMYTEVNSHKLPYASIHYSDSKQSVWDNLVSPFTKASIRGGDLSAPAPSAAKLTELLLCPSDDVPPLEFAVKYGFKRRTYSMPWNKMETANWPPQTNSATGVGLWWASYSKGISSIASLTNAPVKPIASVKLDMLLEPARTILLTEQAKSNNIAGNSSGARIKYTADHFEQGRGESAGHNNGMVNYLMTDGHVELLQPAQTVGHTGQVGTNAALHQGMWTIKAGD